LILLLFSKGFKLDVTVSRRGRMARGGHGLPKVSLGPAMPDPYGRFRGDLPATGRTACSRLLPVRTPHAVRLCMSSVVSRDVMRRVRSDLTFSNFSTLSLNNEDAEVSHKSARERRSAMGQPYPDASFDRNFPCQTLKIRNVSLVVMGS
jgi:hypothetical protein